MRGLDESEEDLAYGNIVRVRAEKEHRDIQIPQDP